MQLNRVMIFLTWEATVFGLISALRAICSLEKPLATPSRIYSCVSLNGLISPSPKAPHQSHHRRLLIDDARNHDP